jgi:mRNA-degrading endonuclease toxin of MazEF toxin-antitoxin module
MSTKDEVSIKYIGKREPWHDRLYRTGLVFDCDQVRTIPWDMARKFLRHEDLFEKVDADAKDEDDATDDAPEDDAQNESDEATDDTQALLDEQEAKNKDKDDEQTELQALYDQVNVMDKEALKDFAQNHYQQNTNNSKSVENIRIDVNGMIDQFGAP